MDSNPEEGGLAALACDREFFSKSGPLPMRWSEVRRFPRFYCRSEASARISPPRAITWDETKSLPVITCDVSRGGLGFLCGEQLFPEQRLEITMPDEATFALKVVWCRRLAAARYAVGCVFMNAPAD
jgi:hypothetical protein